LLTTWKLNLKTFGNISLSLKKRSCFHPNHNWWRYNKAASMYYLNLCGSFFFDFLLTFFSCYYKQCSFHFLWIFKRSFDFQLWIQTGNSMSQPVELSVQFYHERLLRNVYPLSSHIFNIVFYKGNFPLCGSKLPSCLLPKNGNRALITNYRPITILKIFPKSITV
jgi:hypothetical protein